ncbi:hypothetical protein [Streptomyces sp. NBC_00467]|uniref:hypothetical protein n=1 Tax=Streptomyces sp. NBC_00467 TaxID=2975752 RepID=UPI002E18ABA2
MRTPLPEAELTAKHLLLVSDDSELPRYAALLTEKTGELLRRAAGAGEEDIDVSAPLDAETVALLSQRWHDDATRRPRRRPSDLATVRQLLRRLRALSPDGRAAMADRLLTHELRDPRVLRRQGPALRGRAGQPPSGGTE